MGKNLKGKELGKGITQRPDGRYQARYTDRFGKRKSIYSMNLRELKRMLVDAEYEDCNRLSVRDDNMTLDEWFAIWMRTYKNPNIRNSTRMNYSCIYDRHIKPALGDLKISDITTYQVQHFLNQIIEDGYAPGTQGQCRVLLVDMFTCAYRDQMVKRNPVIGVRCASRKRTEDARYLSRYEQDLFFEACQGTWYDNLFNVAVNTGLRPGELAALTWKDIDLQKRILNVNHTLVYMKYPGDEKKQFHLEDTKTVSGRRKVPINVICAEYLQRQHTQKEELSKKKPIQMPYGDRLFVTTANTPVSPAIYAYAVNCITDEIGMERFTPHTFRHTFATRCIEAGIRPKTLQTYLGHSDLKTTMDMYVHVDDDVKHEQMKLLEEAMNSDTIVGFGRRMA